MLQLPMKKSTQRDTNTARWL